MKLFLDANIIVSILNKEYPLYTYTSRILSLADKQKFTIYTSPIADWVSMVAEGPAEYQTKAKTNEQLKSAYFKSKK